LSHEQNRHSLVEFANKTLGSTLDPQMLTVVWARRLTAYKQPELLFSDLEALGDLVQGVQFLLAGKVSPSDPHTLAVANKIKTCLSDSRLAGRVVFLPHYSLAIAKILVSGADVWLNTPLPGKEACGTSSMKAGLNGALLLSTNDGWVAEENWTELGWILSNTDPATTLYRTLREEIIPLFYRRDTNGLPFFWLARMAKMISLCRTKYTTARMLADYKEKLYNL
jgi:starch phosphorylase